MPAVSLGGILTETWRGMHWSAGAVIAGWSFILSENRNTAAENAIFLHDTEVSAMGVLLTKEQFDRECGYRTALSIMENLYAHGLLTDKEYGQIEPFLARKFSPVWADLSDVLSDKSA